MKKNKLVSVEETQGRRIKITYKNKHTQLIILYCQLSYLLKLALGTRISEYIIRSLIIVCYTISTNVYKFNSGIVKQMEKRKKKGKEWEIWLYWICGVFLDKHNGARARSERTRLRSSAQGDGGHQSQVHCWAQTSLGSSAKSNKQVERRNKKPHRHYRGQDQQAEVSAVLFLFCKVCFRSCWV